MEIINFFKSKSFSYLLTTLISKASVFIIIPVSAIFLNTENNINKLLKDIFLFKSQLLGETDSIDKKLTKQNNEIEKDRKMSKKIKNKLISLQNVYNASEPMKEMSNTQFNKTIVDLLLMISIFTVLLFVFYKA